MTEKIVIIGGGVAALNAIKAIRECDSQSDIFLFSNERFYPYYRIRLTKSLFESLMEDKIRIQKIDWYTANRVSVFLGTEVAAVDTKNCDIILMDQSRFAYTKLLLAVGASNFVPPIKGINKSGVYSIRKLEDVQKIQKDLEDKESILNIGGGIQGLETAWILSQRGKRVTLAEIQERLMPRQLDERASYILKKAVESNKIEVLLNTGISEILGESEVSGAVTDSGKKIQCEMVIYSVGIRSNVQLVKGSDIEFRQGIVVNDRLETNFKNIYAAGDIAELDGRIGGTWAAASEMGKTAGYNMAGMEKVYISVVPTTSLNAFNISLFSIGVVDESQCTETLTDSDADDSSYKRIFIRDNRIIGAILIGDTKMSMILKNAIERKVDISHINFSSMMASELMDRLKSN